MAEVREPANIKYAKQILALVEKEIIENRSDISSVKVKHRQLLEEQKRLREEQKKLLRELGRLESEEVCECLDSQKLITIERLEV